MADFHQLPLRLPPDLYAQIAAWGDPHMPMAVKIREILVRYLTQSSLHHAAISQESPRDSRLDLLEQRLETLTARLDALTAASPHDALPISRQESPAISQPSLRDSRESRRGSGAYNPETHKLGRLCKWGHEWRDTGKSLRRKRDSKCLLCDKATSRQYRVRKR